jgi:hypothetical protein
VIGKFTQLSFKIKLRDNHFTLQLIVYDLCAGGGAVVRVSVL